MSDVEAKGNSHPPASVHELTAKNVKAVENMEKAVMAHSTGSERAAAAIVRFCGSIAFVVLQASLFGIWIVANILAPTGHFDAYPFGLLVLVVSLEAIFLFIFILISQNRNQQLSERRNHLDLQINVLAEREDTKLLELLLQIARKHGIDTSEDPEAEILSEKTRPERLAAQIDEMESKEAGKSPV